MSQAEELLSVISRSLLNNELRHEFDLTAINILFF